MATQRKTKTSANDSIRDDLAEIKARAASVAEKSASAIKDRAVDYGEMGRERAHAFQEGMETKVRDHPLRSLLIATGAGLLLGMLWGRRRGS